MHPDSLLSVQLVPSLAATSTRQTLNSSPQRSASSGQLPAYAPSCSTVKSVRGSGTTTAPRRDLSSWGYSRRFPAPSLGWLSVGSGADEFMGRTSGGHTESGRVFASY
ncbi:MAG: hypothetical protein K0S70_1442 [Microbacterium sp.]|nr:hypothetical protein [Microbacterium sp.]